MTVALWLRGEAAITLMSTRARNRLSPVGLPSSATPIASNPRDAAIPQQRRKRYDLEDCASRAV